MKNAEIVEKDGVYYISGKLYEFFDYNEIINIKSDELILDLEGLTYINSIGIRGWLEMNKTLGDKKGSLRNLPFFFANQIIMIYTLKGNFEIESVKLPYFCETCDKEQQILYETKKIQESGIAETLKCPECGDEMTFDECESIADVVADEWSS
jgi:hypothetical protein